MKNMIVIFALLGICLSCGVEPKKEVVPLQEAGDKTHVTVTVNGMKIPHILLDTGFAFDGLIIYNPDYADSLDLTDAMRVILPGAGGGEPSPALMVDSTSFELGGITMRNQRIIFLQSDIYKGFPSNGIIGYSIFGHYQTEFDYDRNIMTLHHADSLDIDKSWSEIPLYFKGNSVPWLDVNVVIDKEPPVTMAVYIDYAAGDPVLLLEKPGMKFQLPEKTNDVFIGRGLSGDIYGKTGFISKLIIGPYELNTVKASFADEGIRSKQQDADGILGVGSLRRFNLIFNYTNRKLYLKPNKHFYDPF